MTNIVIKDRVYINKRLSEETKSCLFGKNILVTGYAGALGCPITGIFSIVSKN